MRSCSRPSSAASSTPSRKWSFTSLLTAVQSAAPTLPKVNVRRNLHSVTQWLHTQGRGGREGEAGDEAEEEGDDGAGYTAQEGMEEQLDPALLATDGLYDVDHLDFTRSVDARGSGVHWATLHPSSADVAVACVRSV